MSWVSLVGKKIIESSGSFESVPICDCARNSELIYDFFTNSYRYEGYCSEERICASIMRDKHSVRMLNLQRGVHNEIAKQTNQSSCAASLKTRQLVRLSVPSLSV
ncbi:MAG: hypothetical protein ACFFB3_11515 [Candidatus Hodarchaeota archaeon]